MRMSQTLRELIQDPATLVMPDAYDAISARVIERAGYAAVQCSGFSIAVSFGYGKETDVSLEENVEQTRRIAAAVSVPVMADGEDGFGEGEALRACIQRYVEVGAAGANIEDQNLRQAGGERVIPMSRMLGKIRDAREAAAEAGDPGFVINARTDALVSCADRAAAQFLAIERANEYLAASATLCFVMGIRTLDELRLFAREVAGPLSVAAGLPYNLGEFTVADCCEIGVARVSLPTVAVMSTVKAMVDTLAELRSTQRFDGLVSRGALMDMPALQALLGPRPSGGA